MDHPPASGMAHLSQGEVEFIHRNPLDDTLCEVPDQSTGMAHLSQEDVEYIHQVPLNGKLRNVQEALRQSGEALLPEGSADPSGQPSLFMEAIDKLLDILSATYTSKALDSRVGSHDLRDDIKSLRRLIKQCDLDHQNFCSLSQLVIDRAPDAHIWDALITVTIALHGYNVPPSIAVPGTPIIHSSASQQGSEQTRPKIEARVFEEISHCTYRAVEGFHKKYFEGHEWDERAKQIWQSAKSRYNNSDKSWLELPVNPTEDQFCSWLFNLQEDLLATERAAYFRSYGLRKVGTEAPRQLDLLVRMRNIGIADARHDWSHVLVVGELKKSNKDQKGLLLQISSIVRNIFAHQPTRMFVHAFTLTGTEMENWVFDRSGPYSGAAFNAHKEPEKFVRILCAYLMMSDKELGLNTFSRTQNDTSFVSLPVWPRGTEKTRLELDPNPIALQRAMVGRGTSCFLAKPVGAQEFDIVVKYSWASNMRTPEADLLIKARDRGVTGLAQVVGYQEKVTTISELRDGLVFTKPYKFRDVPSSISASLSRPQTSSSRSPSQLGGHSIASREHKKRKLASGSSKPRKRLPLNSELADAEQAETGITYSVLEPEVTPLVHQDQTPYNNRILRVLAISPAGRSIAQFNNCIEVLEGLRDAIKAHRSLYMDGKILHRDISENNIILTNPSTADGLKGMLIDLDLAMEVGAGPSGAKHRTGTMEFMAIEVLEGKSHTYRHDLESFFYVLLWLCARRAWLLPSIPGQGPDVSATSLWYTGTYQAIARNKRYDMTGGRLEQLLIEFPDVFDSVKPLCRTIQGILFPWMGNDIFTGTPELPDDLYDPILRAFDDALIRISSNTETAT
ncbi:hypothetical protein E4U41_004648 [Claviceps citrina]|nr:hypothetical protein E4U41_004648 [Claviceps citrina]